MFKPSLLFTLIGAFALFFTISILSSAGEEGRGGSADSRKIGRIVPQEVRPVPLQRAYDFAGEALPMDVQDVRERLERELTVNTYWHSNTLLLLKNSTRFFPAIEQILKKNGLPEDFKYLAMAESSFRMDVSPAGATGTWQFMKGTAEQYGLEVSDDVDERHHLVKSTEAACAYLKKQKEKFGSWTLAAASYNMGSAGLASALEDQRTTDYYALNLNEETLRYIFRIVALKEIISNPEDYGFFLEKGDYYAPYRISKTVKVNSAVENWGDFAKEHDMTYRELKLLNPWLRSAALSNKKGKEYEIAIH